MKFNPYIQEIPVQDYADAEKYKESRYQSGVQQVQSYMDSIANLPVDPKYASYTQTKLNSLTEGVKKVAASDFSNMQLVSQIGGAAKGIASDKIVQNGIMSAQYYKNGLDEMQKAKEKGTLTPDNQWYFHDKQYGEWQKNPDLNTPFSGSYVEHYDIPKALSDAFAKAHVSSREWEESDYYINDQGKRVINPDIIVEKAKKGLYSDKVNSIVNSVLSTPEARQQLGITGMYNYKDYSPSDLLSINDNQISLAKQKTAYYENALKLSKSLTNEEAGQMSQAIKFNQDKQYKLEMQKTQIQSLLASGNIDAARVAIHRNTITEQALTDNAYEDDSLKTKINPDAEMKLKRADSAEKLQMDLFDQDYKTKDLAIKQGHLDIDREDEQRKKDIAAHKLNADGSPAAFYTQPGIDSTQAQGFGANTFEDSMKAFNIQRTQVQADIFSNLEGDYKGIPFKKLFAKDANGQYSYNTDYSTNPNYGTAYKNAIAEIDKQHNQGTVSTYLAPKVQQLYDMNTLLQDQKDTADKAEKNITNIYPHIAQVSQIPNSQNLVNFWMYKNSTTPQAQEAAKRKIVGALGEDGFNRLNNAVNPTPPFSGVGIIGGGSSSYLTVSPEDTKLADAYSTVSNVIRKDPNLAKAFVDRDNIYRSMQMGNISPVVTLTPEDLNKKKVVAARFAAIIQETLAGQSERGIYKGMIEAVTPSKENGELSNTLLQGFKGPDGKSYIQVSSLAGNQIIGRPMEVQPEVLQSLGFKTDPNEQAFQSTIQPFLSLHGGNATTEDFDAPKASINALMRRRIGRFSVGWQFKEVYPDQFLPYLYVNDVKTGEVLLNGVKNNPAVMAKLPGLNAEQKAFVEKGNPLISKQDLVLKIQDLDGKIFTPAYLEQLIKTK